MVLLETGSKEKNFEESSKDRSKGSSESEDEDNSVAHEFSFLIQKVGNKRQVLDGLRR